MKKTDILIELAAFQQQYDKLAVTVEADVLLQGKRLAEALSPQPPLQFSWGKLAAGISWLFEEAKNEANTAYGIAYRTAQSDNYKSVSSTDAKWAAEADDDYNKAVQTKNKVYRLKKDVENCTEVIESRKYILKDLTASIISATDRSKLH